MNLYFDKAGEPIELHEWARLFEDLEYKRVAQDDVGPIHVSTVWLGLDHGFGRKPIIIFETMVFGGELDGECERYSTLEEAQHGHAAMLARVYGSAAKLEG